MNQHPVGWKAALFEIDAVTSANLFVLHMTQWADCAKNVWETLIKNPTPGKDTTASLTITSGAEAAYCLHHALQFGGVRFLARLHYYNIHLLLYRQTMLSLRYDNGTGNLCGKLATDTIEFIELHYEKEVSRPSPSRFHIASSLGSAILIVSTLQARDSHRGYYRPAFDSGLSMLRNLATLVPSAQRILDDLDGAIEISTNPSSKFRNVPHDVRSLFPYYYFHFEEPVPREGLPEWDYRWEESDDKFVERENETRHGGILWL
jgi:hypothetical protein